MPELWWWGGALALLLVGGGWWVYRRRLRFLALERLAEPFVRDAEAGTGFRVPAGLVPGSRWLPVTLSVGLGLLVHFALGLDWVFAAAITLAGIVITSLAYTHIAQQRAYRFETQLTDAIDPIVGGLHAGAGALDALDTAAREVREPLRSHLQDLVGGIRLGETPRHALDELRRAIPLESFRLFCFTLSVHEETGGSLAPTLATVGRTIRDRVDLKRRIRSETTQAQFSVFGMLLIVYGIALITWRTYPDRMETFLGSDLGIRLVSVAVILQAVGLFWMSRLTRIRY
jgi:Flp pilus assembly protein TadB